MRRTQKERKVQPFWSRRGDLPLRNASDSGDNKTGGTSGMQIKVEGYSGFKLNERPVRFHLGGNEYAIEKILDQWFSPDATYFKVRAGDGNDYILKYYSPSDEWTLESYRRPADGE